MFKTATAFLYKEPCVRILLYLNSEKEACESEASTWDIEHFEIHWKDASRELF